jgi:hypothetical protein
MLNLTSPDRLVYSLISKAPEDGGFFFYIPKEEKFYPSNLIFEFHTGNYSFYLAIKDEYLEFVENVINSYLIVNSFHKNIGKLRKEFTKAIENAGKSLKNFYKVKYIDEGNGYRYDFSKLTKGGISND